MGLVVANRSVRNSRVLEIMIKAEKSIYILMLLLAGAAWQIGSLASLIFATAYLIIRITGKLAGGYVAAKFFTTDFKIPNHVGLGLLSQGGIGIAIIINFQQVYHHSYLQLILTIVILATIVNELLSPSLVLKLVKEK